MKRSITICLALTVLPVFSACDASETRSNNQLTSDKTKSTTQESGGLLPKITPLTKGSAYKIGDTLGDTTQIPVPKGYTKIKWSDLMPKGFDPVSQFKTAGLDKMQDSDPRAIEMLNNLKASLSNAPTNPEMEGKAIRIPGFTVPLEFSKKGVTEFLLVPYFGACIHTPPPPANQILHVVTSTPVLQGEDPTMSAVWVSGVIKRATKDTEFGKSGYQVTAFAVEPYTLKK